MIKELFLQKGWAGKTISRAETVERLNPIVRQHIELNNAYAYALKHLSDRDLSDKLAAAQKIARANVGKLAETIYSCGGVAYTGVDLEPENVDLGGDAKQFLPALLVREKSLRDALQAESKVEHQMRTRAILGAVLGSSNERAQLLESNTRGTH